MNDWHSYPWYAPQNAAVAPYVGETPYEPLEANTPAQDTSERPLAESFEEATQDELEAEAARRLYIARHEPLLPANQLGDSLSGNGMEFDTWRDVIDATTVIAIVAGAGNTTVTGPFNLGGAPSSTFSGLSPALQQLLRDVRTPRLALVVRQVAVAGSSTALPNPPSPPAMTTAGAGGTIAAGTYQAAYTWVDAAGETQGSPLEAIVTAGGSSTITWTVPSLPPGATSVRYYLSAVGSTGPLYLQGSNALTSFTLTTPPVVSGVEELPTSNTTTQVTGNILASIVTSAGDTIPLGAFPAGGVVTLPASSLAGPSAMTDLTGNHTLVVQSLGVNAAVPVFFQLAFSFIAVHPHSLAKRFSDLQVNK